MDVRHKGPARLTLDNGDQYDVEAEVITSNRSAHGSIWGPPAFVAFRHGSEAELEIGKFSLPIIITAADLTGPSSFILRGAPKEID